MADKYLDWVEATQAKRPQLAQQLAEFAELYQKRLWHQLTVALERQVEQPDFQQDAGFLPALYGNFIAGFAYRLNPLRLAKIAVTVSKQYSKVSEGSEVFLDLRLQTLVKQANPNSHSVLNIYCNLQLLSWKTFRSI